LIDNTFC